MRLAERYGAEPADSPAAVLKAGVDGVDTGRADLPRAQLPGRSTRRNPGSHWGCLPSRIRMMGVPDV
jgi:hypothetical protein